MKMPLDKIIFDSTFILQNSLCKLYVYFLKSNFPETYKKETPHTVKETKIYLFLYSPFPPFYYRNIIPLTKFFQKLF